MGGDGDNVGLTSLDLGETLASKDGWAVPTFRPYLLEDKGMVVPGPIVLEACLLDSSLASLGCTKTSEVRGVTKLNSKEKLKILVASR